MRIRGIAWVVNLFILTIPGCDKRQSEVPCIDCDDLDFGAIDYGASWSPDSEWIAFCHGDGNPEKSGIWLIRPDGTGARLWQKGFGGYPAWSPDGEWIAFEDGHQIWKRKVNGDSLTQLTNEGRNYFPTWSPDGKKLAFDSNSQSAFYEVMTMNSDGDNKMVVGYSPERPGSRNPHWGKSNQIVHLRFLGSAFSDIFIMDADGDNLKRLTSDDRTNREPNLSPDGLHIVFSSQDHTYGGDARPSLYRVDASGENLQMLARPGILGEWSPDGKTIVYTESSRENGRLWLMAPDGSGKRQLTFENQF